MQSLRQSTVATLICGPMYGYDTTNSLQNSLSFNASHITLSKNGLPLAYKNYTTLNPTISGVGYYYNILDATDTNTLGRLDISINVPSAYPFEQSYMVSPINVYDSLFSTDKLYVGTTLSTADKADYSLAPDQTAVSIGTIIGIVNVGAKTGYSLAADQTSVSIGTVVGNVNVGDKTGYYLAPDQTSVSIGTVIGIVNVGAKTGYSLAADQTTVSIGTVVGAVSAVVSSMDKTGYYLAPTYHNVTIASISGDVAKESTLTEIKGVGWSTQDLVTISNNAETAAGDTSTILSVGVPVSNKTGFYLAPTYQGISIASISGGVNVLTNADKSGYSVTTNLDKSGYSVATNLDKSGYSITSNSDKTGYYLAPDQTSVSIGTVVGFVSGTFTAVVDEEAIATSVAVAVAQVLLGEPTGTNWTYNVTQNGTPINNVWVGVYRNTERTDLVASGYTNVDGNIIFKLNQGQRYYITLIAQGQPMAYDEEVI